MEHIFEPAYIDNEHTEPFRVQGSLLRFGDKILFSNPWSKDSRSHGGIKVRVRSEDGKNWSWERYSRYSKPNEFSGYSDMVRVEGNIVVLFEWGPSNTDSERFHD